MREKRDNEPLYNISIASKLVGVSPRVLRSYEEAGLIKPHRTEGKTRLYSERDIRKMIVIHYLHKEKEVNLAGIKIILSLLSKGESGKNEERKQQVKVKRELLEKIGGIAPEIIPAARDTREGPAGKE